MWSYAVHNLRTGGLIATVFPSDASWETRITGTGSGTFKFVLTDPNTVPLDGIRDTFMPKDRAIAVKWNDDFVAYAGVIARTEYDRGAGTLQVTTEEIRSVFRNRFTGRVDNYGSSWNMNINTDLYEAAHGVVARALSLGVGFGLPIITADDLSPAPSLYPWEMGEHAQLVPSSVDPTGYAIVIANEPGSIDSRSAWGPTVAVTPGQKIRIRAVAGPQAQADGPAAFYMGWGSTPGDATEVRERAALMIVRNGVHVVDVTITVPPGMVAARFSCYVDEGQGAPTGSWYFREMDVRPVRSVGSFTREVRYWETVTVDSLLEEIEAQGCMVDFAPTLTSTGRLVWLLDIATTLNRGLTSLSIDASGSHITELSTTTDGAKQATAVLAVGKGSGADMRTGFATSGEVSSAREVKIDAKDTDRPTELRAAAREAQRELASPVEQWAFKVHIDEGFSPEQVAPGHVLDLSVFGDPWIPDGHVRKTVIALSGDTSLTVTPEVQ